MTTRPKIAAHFDVPQNSQKSSSSTASQTRASHTYTPTRAKFESSKTHVDSPLLRKSTEGGKEERRDLSLDAATQAALNESYKAQNAKLNDSGFNGFQQGRLWDQAKALLATKLGEAALETWIKPCVFVSQESNTLTVAAESPFNRNQTLQRYGAAIRNALQNVAGEEITLKVIVRESVSTPNTEAGMTQEQKPVAIASKSPWAKYQNPSNNPEVAIHLERYGDMRGVILNSPLFKEPCTRPEEGGWGIGVGAMIQAGKQYNLERLIWAIRQTKSYRGANDRGKLFYHILRKGMEGRK